MVEKVEKTEKKRKAAPVLEVLGVRVVGQDHVSQRSGSVGYNFNQAKIVDSDGVEYTFSGNLTIIGTSAFYSKATPEMKAAAQARAEAATEAAAARKAERERD